MPPFLDSLIIIVVWGGWKIYYSYLQCIVITVISHPLPLTGASSQLVPFLLPLTLSSQLVPFLPLWSPLTFLFFFPGPMQIVAAVMCS